MSVMLAVCQVVCLNFCPRGVLMKGIPRTDKAVCGFIIIFLLEIKFILSLIQVQSFKMWIRFRKNSEFVQLQIQALLMLPFNNSLLNITLISLLFSSSYHSFTYSFIHSFISIIKWPSPNQISTKWLIDILHYDLNKCCYSNLCLTNS